MVFQEYNLVERLTVIENVLCGRLGYVPVWRAWTRRFPDADLAQAFALLDSVGLAEFATRRADQPSGGQRQRVQYNLKSSDFPSGRDRSLAPCSGEPGWTVRSRECGSHATGVRGRAIYARSRLAVSD